MRAKTDDPRYIRDLRSGGLLAVDKNALMKHRTEVKKFNEIKQEVNEINNLKSEIKNINSRLDQIFELLNRKQ